MRRPRRRLALLLAAALAVAGAVTVAQPAAAVGTGSISGTATANGHARAGIFVSAYLQNGNFGGNAQTAANGTYSITGLAAGSYTVQFDVPGENFIPEWWNNHLDLAQAEYFPVGTGAVTGKDADLAVGIVLGGVVSGAGLGSGGAAGPLANAQIDLYDASRTKITSTFSTASGQYSFSRLPMQTYYLGFSAPGNWIPEFWNDQATIDAATPISVFAGQTVLSFSPTLATGVTVSGTITGPGGALSYANATAYDPSGQQVGWSTSTGGQYSIQGLRPGQSIAIRYSDYGDTPRPAPQYRGGATLWVDAQFFTVPSGPTTGINVTLQAGATITGVVRNFDGAGLNGGIALLFRAGELPPGSGDYITAAGLASGSRYTLDGLAIGSYKLGFTTHGTGLSLEPEPLSDSTFEGYVSQFYSGQYSYASATPINVTAVGQAIGDDNIVLQYVASFADVTDPAGTFYPYINWMSRSALSTGTAQPSGLPLYKPGDAVSRQAMASFLYKLSGATFSPPGTGHFADVPPSSSFYTAIEWMYAQGISLGTSQPSGLPLYKPADPVSRQAMASFLSRYAHATLTTPTTADFADVPVTSGPAAAIHWMKITGISTGTPQPSGLPLYKPSDPVSRQAMAAFLFRLAHLP